jgi:hypothetical protein
MAVQFCKFQEILFRKVVIDEYYYQLKLMHLFLLHPVYLSKIEGAIFLTRII